MRSVKYTISISLLALLLSCQTAVKQNAKSVANSTICNTNLCASDSAAQAMEINQDSDSTLYYTNLCDPSSDLIIYGSDWCDYACYFPKGRYDKESLHNIINITSSYITTPDKYSDLHSMLNEKISIKEITRYYDSIIDARSQLKVLDFEPWITLNRKLIDFDRAQFDKNIIIAKGIQSPQTLYQYEGVKRDSMMKKCIDILNRSGEHFVSKTRSLMTNLIRIEALTNKTMTLKQKKFYIDYTTSRMEDRLCGSDSLHAAKSELLRTISNRINTQIHDKNDIFAHGGIMKGWEYEFHKLFDSVKAFNICEP